MEEHLDLQNQPTIPHVAEVLAPASAESRPAPSNAIIPTSPSPDLAEGVATIAQVAHSVLGADAGIWLSRPKAGLSNQVPIELMKTREGRQQVLDLLLKIRQYD